MRGANHYETLGVSRNATIAEIKAAFRKHAKAWHPDINKRPDATERFRAYAEAYECLADPAQRRELDETLRQAEQHREYRARQEFRDRTRHRTDGASGAKHDKRNEQSRQKQNSEQGSKSRDEAKSGPSQDAHHENSREEPRSQNDSRAQSRARPETPPRTPPQPSVTEEWNEALRFDVTNLVAFFERVDFWLRRIVAARARHSA